MILYTKLLLLILLAAILLSPTLAGAQGDLSLAAVEVDLWPEFDKPSMLVIYSLTLPPGTSLPVEMEFLIPAGAGVPNAVAAMQPDGVLIDLKYEQTPGEDFSRLKFTALTPQIQIEYYDPSLEKDNDTRHYEYRWPGTYQVGRFRIEIQQPPSATSMRFSPSLESSSVYSDGLTYYSSDVGQLPLGQTFAINLEYQKENDDLTAPNMPVAPSAPIGETPGAETTAREFLPWLIGVLGVLLIAGGAVWYWQSGRRTSSSTPVLRRRRKSTQAGISLDEAEHIYCHQCGNRASRGDHYCRFCGSQLRGG